MTQNTMPRELSARYGGFPYLTVKDRMPVILTKAVDSLCRNRRRLDLLGIVDEKHLAEAEEETKEVIGRLSKLRNELQTNKEIVELESKGTDVEIWNKAIRDYHHSNGGPLFWFEVLWLFVECYFYRRIREAFELSTHLQQIDPFEEQKREALTSSMTAITTLAQYLKTLSTQPLADNTKKAEFFKFLELCLWGNRCDLSLSGGAQNSQLTSPLDDIEKFRSRILVNDMQLIWEAVSAKNRKIQIALILDNTGFELYSDFCLLEFIFAAGLLDSDSVVKFYVKTMPWFVSDTMHKDLNWLLGYLASESCKPEVQYFAKKWNEYFSRKQWQIVESGFWTLPYDFSHMQSMNPKLYGELAKNDLIIFKGDLNYRKLVGDFDWPFDTDFRTALRGFLPTSLCTLRTLKSDPVVGLSNEVIETLSTLPENWRFTGDYAVVQYVMK